MSGSHAIRPAPELPEGPRAALVVATTTYVDPVLRRLRSPATDAAELAGVLGDPQIGGFQVTTVLDPTAQQLRIAAEEFLSARGPQDLAVLYLSCHGLTDLRRRLYFAASDTVKARLAATALESSWLLNQLEECRAPSQVLILDCCFSGAVARGFKGENDLGLHDRLARSGRGRVVLTASNAREYSFEGSLKADVAKEETAPGSVFTSVLVEGMRTGAADADGDGRITVDDVYDYAYHQVRTAGAAQTPQRWLAAAEGQIVLARNPLGVLVTPAPIPESLRVVLDNPHPNVRIGAVHELAEWLASGEPGRELAAQQLLEHVAESDIPQVAEAARALLPQRTDAAEAQSIDFHATSDLYPNAPRSGDVTALGPPKSGQSALVTRTHEWWPAADSDLAPRAHRRFTVRSALPEPLAPLSQLVMNLRWSWHAETRDLFEALDPELWRACNGDPVKVLGEVSAERLAALARDRRFVRRLGDVVDDLHDYLAAPHWYQTLGPDAPAAIAYFSAEFGISEVLPQYSGGLGIMAGDHLKAASDLGVPLVGVGLLYRAGYFTQSLSADGWQLEHYPSLDPHGLPLKQLRHNDGLPVIITVPLPEGRTLHAHVWRVQVGRVTLLLLDSDIEENAPAERSVTDRLFGGDEDHRLRQAMLLGIGGVRALRMWCTLTGLPAPEVYHANDGHAGFLGIERIRELIESHGLSFDEALQAARPSTVFTTHSLVPAGTDAFRRSLVERYFRDFGLPMEQLLALGTEQDQTMFSMAHLGLRLGQRANGVSEMHGSVSRHMFRGLWPGTADEDVPIGAITSGVHATTWTARELVELGTQLSSEGVPEHVDGPVLFDGVDRIPARELWNVRRLLRGRLLEEVRRRLRETALSRGATEVEVGWTETAFDPDVLTVGFCHPVQAYRRLTLILTDPDRLQALLLDPERPVQMLIAGKCHPSDDGGKRLIEQVVKFADDREVRHRIAFLPGYDIGMARPLYRGCDVWLNNPLRPLEACGTSGMKAALNGALNLSIRDGWWDQWFDGQNGWAIPAADGVADLDRRDEVEARAIYELLEHHVVPRFYERDLDGIPTRWVEMVRHTLRETVPKVLASRMVREYVRHSYVGAAAFSREMAVDGYSTAKKQAAWRARVLEARGKVRVVDIKATGAGDTPEIGSTLALQAEVELASLSPSEVEVQAGFGRVDDADRLHDVTWISMTHERGDGSRHWFTGTLPLQGTGAFGYAVRVLPYSRYFANTAELGVIAANG